ncbi:hypothetical protein LIER_04995 [Lithospermum erythrorhizon]|uniref:DUF4005 domain-containing protein n=1 Tax=Lithospermum erythrorhizon TaxID=34254 RepID=A0AAV3P3I9_LITER
MGKSPAKWIKTVLFGKKSSKTSSAKNVIIERRASTKELESIIVPAAPDLPQVVDQGTETMDIESPSDATDPIYVEESMSSGGVIGAKFDDAEVLRLDQAATKAQSVFRGYLARRAFWALKGIIRLQALIRGHLVRRQAVATLRCMQAIVKIQALARGQKVRVLYPGHVLEGVKPQNAARIELSGSSVGSQKLMANAFVMKLYSSLPSAMPLSLQYDSSEPNSSWNWLERWSSVRLWEPLPQLKKKPSLKAQSKRTFKKVRATLTSNNMVPNTTEIDKPRRNSRKVPNHHSDSVTELSQNELERVKRNLKRVSAPSALPSETSEIEIEKALDNLPKVLNSPTLDVCEKGPEDYFEKLTDAEIIEKPSITEDPPTSSNVDKPIDVQCSEHPAPQDLENGQKVESNPSVDGELNSKDQQVSKDNQKTRRRSLPTKQECPENVSQNSPSLPSYMAATKSAKAKLRAQGAPKVEEDGNNVKKGNVRRHSLPSSTNAKASSSPRMHRPLQANGKGGNNNNRPQTSSKDDKTLQPGWKR